MASLMSRGKLHKILGWKFQFYDQIIRNKISFHNIRNYIKQNPKNVVMTQLIIKDFGFNYSRWTPFKKKDSLISFTRL